MQKSFIFSVLTGLIVLPLSAWAQPRCETYFSANNPYSFAERLAELRYQIQRDPTIYKDPSSAARTRAQLREGLEGLMKWGPRFVQHYNSSLIAKNRISDKSGETKTAELRRELIATEKQHLFTESIQLKNWEVALKLLEEFPELDINVDGGAAFIYSVHDDFSWRNNEIFRVAFLKKILGDPRFQAGGENPHDTAAALKFEPTFENFKKFFKSRQNEMFDPNIFSDAVSLGRFEIAEYVLSKMPAKEVAPFLAESFPNQFHWDISPHQIFFFMNHGFKIDAEQLFIISSKAELTQDYARLLRVLLPRPEYDRGFRSGKKQRTIFGAFLKHFESRKNVPQNPQDKKIFEELKAFFLANGYEAE